MSLETCCPLSAIPKPFEIPLPPKKYRHHFVLKEVGEGQLERREGV